MEGVKKVKSIFLSMFDCIRRSNLELKITHLIQVFQFIRLELI